MLILLVIFMIVIGTYSFFDTIAIGKPSSFLEYLFLLIICIIFSPLIFLSTAVDLIKKVIK